ncbi:MAG: Na(+)-translocating NADH-quinone reductase subunit C [Gammaproteobacteria bacterium]
MSAEKQDSIARVFTVAFVVCLVSAVVVSSAVVLLRPVQDINKNLDVQTNILDAAGLHQDGMDVGAVFAQRIEVKLVDLRNGTFAEAAAAGVADVVAYDQRLATKNPALSSAIPAAEDIAAIKRKPHYAKVYLIKDDTGALEKVVLPVSGYGLWSTMYGYLVLGSDLNTVVGLTFTEHGETPGLGGEVDNPKWKAQWPGKQVYDADGKVVAGLKKGGVDAENPFDKAHLVDGLAGATLTSDGVNDLIHYWLGEHGFGPFLKNLKQGGI